MTGQNYVTQISVATTVLYAQSTTDRNPDNHAIEVGYGDGDPTSHLNSSDNNYVSILQDDTQLANPLAAIVIYGNVNTAATELCFEVESKVSAGGLQQRVQIWNYDSGAYETFDTRAATTSDRTLHIQIPLDPGPYINTGGDVKARILFDDVGVFELNPWTAYIDVGQWTVLNKGASIPYPFLPRKEGAPPAPSPKTERGPFASAGVPDAGLPPQQYQKPSNFTST